MLDEASRKVLLSAAREAVRAAAGGSRPPAPPGLPGCSGYADSGAFVTLTANGELRGCIGLFRGTGDLGRTVVGMAAAAAVDDPRFPPVRPSEVDGLDIDISVLGPILKSSPDLVVPGVHGILVQGGGRSGTLLPQVAVEQGWSREELLTHACLKVGLPPDAWRHGSVVVSTYTAEVFGDSGRKG